MKIFFLLFLSEWVRGKFPYEYIYIPNLRIFEIVDLIFGYFLDGCEMGEGGVGEGVGVHRDRGANSVHAGSESRHVIGYCFLSTEANNFNKSLGSKQSPS